MSEKNLSKQTLKKRKEYSQEEIDANKYVYNHFDSNFVRQINNSILSIIADVYFRPVFIGFDEMPERNNPDRPVILASNHSGMSFPWDAMIFGCGIQKQFDYDESKTFRAIIAPGLSGIPAMHPFYMKGAWKVSGGVDATFLNFETMMHYPEGHLLIYPEGVPGIGKGFNNKYKLQRFATSFIRMSLKHKTDILPYATVNAEYTIPFVYSSDWVNRQFNKIGVPFMSLGIPTLALIFPFAFYMAFPANMHFIKGTRISPWKWTDKSYEDMTEEEINEIRDKVKSSMQEDLDNAVELYGKKPYNVKHLIKIMWKKRGCFPYNLPIFWPLLFHEFNRQWIKKEKYKSKEDIVIKTGWGTFIRLMILNPITVFYFIPILGWFFLLFYGNRKWKKLDELGKPFS